MMHPRWIALCLAASTGCGTLTSTAAPRLLPPDMHIGGLDQRTSFELDDRGSATANRDLHDDLEDPDPAPTPKQQRRRRLLYFTGLGAVGFGLLGTVGFGVGGRIVQAQMRNGLDDGTLTLDRHDQLSTTGKVMNGMAIGSAVVGLLGLITATAIYGYDHAHCGKLPPRRKHCPRADDIDDESTTEQPPPAKAAEAEAAGPVVGPEEPPAAAEPPATAEPPTAAAPAAGR